MSDWSLSGEARNKMYRSQLIFVSKEVVPVPANLVEEHLHIAGKKEDPEYRKAIEFQEQAAFRTETGDTVIVSPRYVGSKLGSNDDGEGNTICGFTYNGEYVALALYNENQKSIIAFER